MSDNIPVKQIRDNAETKTDDFAELLERIEYASPEMKKLWREIYQNSMDDRTAAHLLYADLYQNVVNNQQGHLNHGILMTKYLERMNKANDQLLKLAELIENATTMDQSLDVESLYAELPQE